MLPLNKGVVVLLFWCLAVVASFMQGTMAAAGPPAMYVFGDSTLDVGNNNYLEGEGVIRANKPYYGIDFPGFPAGKFSNGHNTADYVAKSMGFVDSPPAYLSLVAQSSHEHQDVVVLTALRMGVNYASGGAGILDTTHAGETIPLSKQVQYFNATKAGMVAARGSVAVNALLAESVVLIGIGTNDMIVYPQEYAKQNSSEQQQQQRVKEFYNNLVSNYKAAITELYQLGLRKFAIINVGFLGCSPAARVRNPNNGAAACWESLNQLTAGFNARLPSLLASRSRRLPGLSYSLGDSYSLSVDIIANPLAQGFTNVTGACCGSGPLNAGAICNPNSRPCTHRARYLYWDGIHVTQHSSFLTIKALYDGPDKYTHPINFKQLARN